MASKDTVSLSGTTHTSNELPDTTLRRIRDASTLNETPQFIAGDDPTWNNAEVPDDSDGMIAAVDERGSILHFYSVARQSATVGDNQDNGEFTFGDGGDTAFRHQKIIELLPWFASNEEDRIIYSRIVHLLRFTPEWNRGNPVLPLPLHLAEALSRNASEVLMSQI